MYLLSRLLLLCFVVNWLLGVDPHSGRKLGQWTLHCCFYQVWIKLNPRTEVALFECLLIDCVQFFWNEPWWVFLFCSILLRKEEHSNHTQVRTKTTSQRMSEWNVFGLVPSTLLQFDCGEKVIWLWVDFEFPGSETSLMCIMGSRCKLTNLSC